LLVLKKRASPASMKVTSSTLGTFLAALSVCAAHVVNGVDDTCTSTEEVAEDISLLSRVHSMGREGKADDTDPPTVQNLVPDSGMTIGSTEYVFAASVTDDSGIRSVKFIFRDPNGTIEQLDGALDDQVPGDYSVSKSDMASGSWKWRIRTTDASTARNTVVTDWYDLEVIASVEDGIAAVRSEVESIMRADSTLKAKFVRLGFHDCVGGCDGCVDLELDDNNGLDVPIEALDSVVDAYVNEASGLTRADIWAHAALLGAELSQPSDDDYISFPMTWVGRKGCEDLNDVCLNEDGVSVACDKTHGPHRVLPGASLTTSEIVNYFDQEFGYTAQETVAIMGAHTIGTASRDNSGFQGEDGWVPNKLQLNNNYYDWLVGGDDENDDQATLFHANDWTQEFINNVDRTSEDQFQWFHIRSGDVDGTLLMLNSDISMVRDLTDYMNEDTGEVTCQFRCNGRVSNQNCDNTPQPVCPLATMTFDFAAEYKFNNTLWLTDFRSVFSAMLVHGYEDVVAAGCDSEPCHLG